MDQKATFVCSLSNYMCIRFFNLDFFIWCLVWILVCAACRTGNKVIEESRVGFEFISVLGQQTERDIWLLHQLKTLQCVIMDWEEAYKNFSDSNIVYYSELLMADRELDQSSWYKPKDDSFRQFREEINQWLRDEALEIGPNDCVSQVGSMSSRRYKKSPSVISSLASSTSSARMNVENIPSVQTEVLHKSLW